MIDTCLTDEEVARYTFPLTQGKARCKYFERVYKVKVIPRPDGQPTVGRAEFEAAMLSKERADAAKQAPSHRTEGNVVKLDLAAMQAARRGRSKEPA
jgi:hypothetical protein